MLLNFKDTRVNIADLNGKSGVESSQLLQDAAKLLLN